MSSSRRLSQAISEGDGISLLVPVTDIDAARAAEADGAEGVVVRDTLGGLRNAIGLPVLVRSDGRSIAVPADADACVLRVDELSGDWERLRELQREAESLGVEPVVGVKDDDELELALEHVDPEIVLLAPPAPDADEDLLENVLDLLPDVPAGKLAIAEVAVRTRDHVVALERAGVDAVIVSSGDIAALVGGPTPEV
jgi:indole-3-glycerol phosphate synthase